MNILTRKINIVFVLLLILVSGCDRIASNSNLAEIDRQIIKVSDHVYTISQDGTYYNENIDFALLDRAKKSTLESLDKLLIEYEEGSVTQEELDEGIKKSTTLLYFVWMEEFDAAWMYKNANKLLSIQSEQTELTKKYLIEKWLTENDKKNDITAINELFTNLIQAANLGKNIDNNNKKLEEYMQAIDKIAPEENSDGYYQKVTEYNELVAINQELIEQYNGIVSNYSPENIYNVFLAMIETDILFNGQSQLEIKI